MWVSGANSARTRGNAGWTAVLAAVCALFLACEEDDPVPGVKTSAAQTSGRRDAGAGNDAGGDAAAAGNGGSSGGTGGDFGFGELGVDGGDADGASAQPSDDAGVTGDWACDPALLGDAVCDCGCGAPDPRCGDRGCTGPDCSAIGCQVCFGRDGSTRDCAAPVSFSCRPERLDDGVCDCGCGALDPDCEQGCFAAGCNVDGCDRCNGNGAIETCGRPAKLSCKDGVRGDGVCDCGCGNYDPDCTGSSCIEPGCFALGCELCHDASGKAIDCVAPQRCAAAVLDDGVCDCGCGSADPDCGAGKGCTLPGCAADGCAVCHDAAGRPTPCPGTFSCETERYNDGAQCDCGCGRPDPDCRGQGCSEPGCEAAACDLRHDVGGKVLRPGTWVCEASRFGAIDGCDCGCGAVDADCVDGCSGPGCRAPDCDSCRAADGSAFPCGWTCPLERYQDGEQCDCGCGISDPDCRERGCSEAGCFAPACSTCSGASGGLECERGRCDRAYFADGVCDCGCRERDPDCGGAQVCLEPGCSAVGCERCHGGGGGVVACGDWSCGFEGQGGGDGCNCGCGAPDPDCGAGEGCAMPGCRAAACTTCRSAQGSPVSCSQ